MAGEVSLQYALGKPNVPVTNTQQLAYLLIEAKPIAQMVAIRMPLNLALVLDRSGSMDGARFNNLKKATRFVLDHMQPDDHLSLVTFTYDGELLAPCQPVTSRKRLEKLIRDMDCVHIPPFMRPILEAQARAGQIAGTRISTGMQLGLAQVQKALDRARVSRIVLLTDGQSHGDDAQCRQLAQDAGRLGVPIIALGLGEDWNEELLDTIAHASGGVADYIASPEEIGHYFQSAVQSMQATALSNARLTLRLTAGIAPRQVWRVTPLIANLGYQPLSDRDVQVHLGGLEKEHGQALLVELLLPPRSAGRYRIAQVEISYDVPAASIVDEKVRSDILLTFTDDPALPQQHDARVMNIVEKVTAFKLQTRALEEAKAGNIDSATEKLRAVATRLLEMGEAELAAAAEEEAKRLEQGQTISSAGTKKLQYGTRKLTQRLE